MQQEPLPSRKILREGKYIRESSAFFNPRGQVRPLVSKISWRQEQSRDAGRKWKGLAMRGLLFKDDFIRHRAFMTRFVDIIKIWKTDKVGDAKTKALKEKNGKVSIRYTLPLRGASPAGHPALGEVGTSCSRGAISRGRLGNPLEENREIQAVLRRKWWGEIVWCWIRGSGSSCESHEDVFACPAWIMSSLMSEPY